VTEGSPGSELPEPELLFFVRTSLEIRFFFVTAPAKKKPGKKKTG
jgi:hypothetical protein